ncbi:MAG: cyclase family protein [Halanaerobiales bacterium]
MLPDILYDISMEISPDMAVYKDRDAKRPVFEVTSDHQTASAYETRITMDMHTGTHIDAPLHMIKDGNTMEYFSFKNTFNDCIVLDLKDVEGGITGDDIHNVVLKDIKVNNVDINIESNNSDKDLLKSNKNNNDCIHNTGNLLKDRVVLLQTRNSYENRKEDFIYLAESGADYLIDNGIIGVGIDTLGIERSQEGHPTHKKLLSEKIFIIEGLELKDVLPGLYTLLLVPLKIKGVEAAPARAFLLGKA